jgi:hypothetical protein
VIVHNVGIMVVKKNDDDFFALEARASGFISACGAYGSRDRIPVMV